MMGTRIKLNGSEEDVVYAREVYRPPAGVCREWKRRINKRIRRNAKAELKQAS